MQVFDAGLSFFCPRIPISNGWDPFAKGPEPTDEFYPSLWFASFLLFTSIALTLVSTVAFLTLAPGYSL